MAWELMGRGRANDCTAHRAENPPAATTPNQRPHCWPLLRSPAAVSEQPPAAPTFVRPPAQHEPRDPPRRGQAHQRDRPALRAQPPDRVRHCVRVKDKGRARQRRQPVAARDGKHLFGEKGDRCDAAPWAAQRRGCGISSGARSCCGAATCRGCSCSVNQMSRGLRALAHPAAVRATRPCAPRSTAPARPPRRLFSLGA